MVLVLVAMAAASPARAQPSEIRLPTTLPTTRPASPQRLAMIRQLLGQLASEDSGRRDQARLDLMGLSRSDLPILKEAIGQLAPLEPSQAAVLRDIVTQIYLAGDMYSGASGGFLGIRLPHDMSFRPEERALLAVNRGVVVVARIPGFCAFRMLQDGDVILSLMAAGSAQPIELNDPNQLTSAIVRVPAGQEITFEVVRQGQIIRVPIVLDRRPAAVDQKETDEFISERSQAAEALWEREFAPLLSKEEPKTLAKSSDLDGT